MEESILDGSLSEDTYNNIRSNAYEGAYFGQGQSQPIRTPQEVLIDAAQRTGINYSIDPNGTVLDPDGVVTTLDNALKKVGDFVKILDHPYITRAEIFAVLTAAGAKLLSADQAQAAGDITQAEILRHEASTDVAAWGGEFIGSVVGGFYGFTAGAAAAGAATSFLNIGGPAGTAVNLVLTVVGGLTGAVVGGEVVESNVRYLMDNLGTFTTQGWQDLIDDYTWAINNTDSIYAYLVEEFQEALYGATGEEALKPSSMPTYDELFSDTDVTYKHDTVSGVHKVETFNGGSIRVEADGSGYLFYTDLETNIQYMLNIGANGEISLSTTRDLYITKSFGLFHELDPEDRASLETLVGLINGDKPALDAFLSTLPATQEQALRSALSSFTNGAFDSEGSLVIPIPGFKPVPPGQDSGESDVQIGKAHTEADFTVLDKYDGTEGEGFQSVIFGNGGDTYTNSQLFNLLKSNDVDVAAKAFAGLYSRAVEYGQFDAVDGPVTLQIEGGGYFQIEYDQTGKMLATLNDPNGVFAARLVDDVTVQTIGGLVKGQFLETVSENGDTNVRALMELTETGRIAVSKYVIADEHYASFQGVVTDFAADYFAAKFADGDLIEKALYQSAFRTISQNFDTFTGLLSDGIPPDIALDAVVKGTNVELPDGNTTAVSNKILDDVLVNFVNVSQGVIASLIVQEVGEVLDIGGVGGEVFSVVANEVTVQFVGEAFDVVFGGLLGEQYPNLIDGKFNVDQLTAFDPVALIARFTAAKLAGAVISPENETAGVLGSLGASVGGAIGTGQIVISQAVTKVFTVIGSTIPIPGIGLAIGAFVGQVFGTALGNVIGDEDTPSSWGVLSYNEFTKEYYLSDNTQYDGGGLQIGADLASALADGINSIIATTNGSLRSTSNAEGITIGWKEGKFLVIGSSGNIKEFDNSGEAISYAAFKTLKDFDLVGGHAVVMRAWHNSDAQNLQEFKEDIEVAEAFIEYLKNPTGILALMMDQPDSALAQSWAAILQRSAELELHLPSDKDLDGGWNEVLIANGVDPQSLANIEETTLTVTDPVTGEETVFRYLIGPGYEIVRIEGTDGNDIINVTVDGAAISYVDAGSGNDIINGSDERDVIFGGTGDDTINGNAGDDWLNGGAGNDTINGNNGLDLIVGGDDNDILTGGNNGDYIYGGFGADTLTGGAGTDYLYGGDGDDTLRGDDDSVIDYLYGGDGNDTLYGNGDLLFGGKGDDYFVWGNTQDGDESIVVKRGDGNDTIEFTSSYSTFIIFDDSIGMNELWFHLDPENSNNLIISVIGEDQSLKILNYMDSGVHIKTQGFYIDTRDLETNSYSPLGSVAR